MIDFHCHLDLYPDPHGVTQECVRRGLYILSVTTTPSAWNGTAALASGQQRIRTALGLHPQIAHQRKHELGLFDQTLPETRYVGEVGLDGSPECKKHWSDQVTVFTHILQACNAAGGRILSIHSRRAAASVLDLLEKHPGAGTFVLHWFSGTERELSRAIDMGCWFSVGPAMLAAERGRRLALRMPHDRVLTETDGPFARVGDVAVKPWDVAGAIDVLASVWDTAPAETAATVKANFEKLVSVS
ncbi:MAG TPA: Qat anti-phage system TatD family nuclease QatD [Burkholderiaceae bacterium]|nr:Qat anti-phage system TatD family nuclease QatD [Burkholderiaceae bacterium]